LGLVLYKRLKWGLNNQERTKKATIALYSYKKAIGLRWGMSPKLFNRAKAGNEDTNWHKYELASYKKAIRRAKRTAWQTYCSDIEKTTNAARLRIFRKQTIMVRLQ